MGESTAALSACVPLSDRRWGSHSVPVMAVLFFAYEDYIIVDGKDQSHRITIDRRLPTSRKRKFKTWQLQSPKEGDGLLLPDRLLHNILQEGNGFLLPELYPGHFLSTDGWEEQANGGAIDEVSQETQAQGGECQFEQHGLAMGGEDERS